MALIDGGCEPLPGAFDRRLRDGLAATDAEIVDPARVNAMFPGRTLDAPEVADWLNKLEHAAPLVVYLGGREASAWARKAIRQADMVVFACRGDAPAEALTEVEAFAREIAEAAPPSFGVGGLEGRGGSAEHGQRRHHQHSAVVSTNSTDRIAGTG